MCYMIYDSDLRYGFWVLMRANERDSVSVGFDRDESESSRFIIGIGIGFDVREVEERVPGSCHHHPPNFIPDSQPNSDRRPSDRDRYRSGASS